MNDGTLIMQAETPGFFPVMEVDGRWGVVRAADRKIVRSGIPTEQEAREIAGTSSIRMDIAELCEIAIQSVAERSVLMFKNRPHTEDFEMRCLIAGIRGQIERHLEVDLPKWASESSERIRASQEKLNTLCEMTEAKKVEARTKEKEQDDGTN